jgi:hypothetical protein
MNHLYKVSIGVIFSTIISLVLYPAKAAEEFSPYVDKKGNINFPDGFRTQFPGRFSYLHGALRILVCA